MYPKITIYTLILSLITLSWMVPGGPVETRSFSNIDSAIVLGFNIFLTSLVLGALVLIYFMFKKQKWAYSLTFLVGVAFVIVFLLDLLGIFPVSLDSMNQLLFILEILGTLFGFSLMYLSYVTLKYTPSEYWSGNFQVPFSLIVIGSFLLLFGVYVIYFATKSALH